MTYSATTPLFAGIMIELRAAGRNIFTPERLCRQGDGGGGWPNQKPLLDANSR